MVSNWFIITISVIGLAFALISLLLGVYVKKRRIVKYIPAIIAGISALGFYVKAAWFSQGFEGLGYIVLAMIAAGLFVVSIIPVVIIEIINRRQ